jgi:glycosyltransferase involved in cell wall biosynthesis
VLLEAMALGTPCVATRIADKLIANAQELLARTYR